MKIRDFPFDAPLPSRPVITAAEGQAESIVSRFRQVAARVGTRPAVCDESAAFTYGELDRLSDRIARFIHGLHLGPEARVGLMFGRDRGYVAAVLGVLKAGAVYVPLDPVLPLEHRRRLVDLSGARLIIAGAALCRDLHLLQWQCSSVEHILMPDSDDIDGLIETPGPLMSSELWDHLAGEAADDILAGGWKSAFTGQPLPAEAMEAFGNNARAKVEPFLGAGARVLEIGCASGFTVRKVATLASSYLAVDISRRNVERVESYALRQGLGQVSARQMTAHDVDIFPAGSFDLVIMNSVVEAFPGYGYLRSVLHKVLALLAPGGALFLGSVWNLDRRGQYLADLSEFARQNAGRGFQTRLEFPDELFVPPAFFRDWAAERGDGLSLTFSPIDAPGFEPAAYGYDLLMRPQPGRQEKQPAPARRRYDRRSLHDQPDGPPPVEVRPQDAAYVIFTSGTTGRPKGVMVEHHSVVNLARSVERTLFAALEPEKGLAVSCIASFAFDGSVKQIFATLLCGHTIHLPGEDIKREPGRLHAFIEERRLDLCDPTPSLFAMLVDHWRESRLSTSARTYLLGGEVVQADLLRSFYALPGHGDVRVINAYGPTECCVAACQHIMTAASWQEVLPPPIGTPLAGVEIEVCDVAGRPLPQGVPGEIRIGGAGVARGYLDDPALTAERFVTDAQARRWYRSGDMGRWLAGGLLHFLGREDRQVKIRGNRIELAEVEAALTAHPLVRRAAVVAADPRRDGNRLLAAYLMPRPGFNLALLKAELDATLPPYLVPSWLVTLEDIPLTPNGKVDEARLPSPSEASSSSNAPASPLVTETERRLAAVWSEVLEVPVEDGEANFFVLGGHSVLAVRLLASVELEFGVRLPLSQLFASPTVVRLAERIDAGTRGEKWQSLVGVRSGGRQAPLICFHPVGGNVLCYQALAERLGEDQPVYMVQAQGLEDGHALLPTVEDMVAAYLRDLRRQLSDGPLVLAGWSFGGLLAYEAACRLQRAGAVVRAVILFDAVAAPEPVREMLRQDEAEYLSALFEETGVVSAGDLRGLGPDERLDLLVQRAQGSEYWPGITDREGMRRLLGLFQNNALAAIRYRPPRIEGSLLLIRPRIPTRAAPGVPGDDLNGWGPLASGGVTLRWMEGTHGQMLYPPQVDQLAGFVRSYLDRE